MRRILFMSLDAAIAALILAPIFWILHRKVFQSKGRTIRYYLFAVYLCAVFAVVGLPDILYIRYEPHFNFVPFAYMFSDFTSSFLNVILFVPMGIFLPLLWKDFRPFWKTLLFGFAASFFIELLQIFTFRASDINDLMTNSVGTVIGWFLSRLFLHLFPSINPKSCRKDLYWVLGTTLAVMYFLHPFFSKLIWIPFS